MDHCERGEPLVIGEEDLRDIGRHRDGVDRHRLGDGRCVPVNPGDATRARLGASDLERRTGRVDADDGDPTAGQHQREDAGAASEVEDGAGAELGDQRDVRIEIRTIRVEGVVDCGEPRVVEDRVRQRAPSDDLDRQRDGSPAAEA